MVTLYGISNCDTIRKAKQWLNDNKVLYNFHDYRKQGIEKGLLVRWLDKLDWQELINKRGTTWRNLPEQQKAKITTESAMQLMLEQPAIIKRPLLECGDRPVLGFNITVYNNLFSERIC